jgi:hypothetical protein
MGATFTASPGLDQRVAEMIVPAMTGIARDVRDANRSLAPAEKVWTSSGDALVRKWHRDVDGQTVPDNLRFNLETPEWEIRNEGYGPREMCREPRDPELSYVNRVHCRCWLKYIPDGVSKTIHAEPARAVGTVCSAPVYCDHRLSVPAEFGNDVDRGARFMAGGIRVAAARL